MKNPEPVSPVPMTLCQRLILAAKVGPLPTSKVVNWQEAVATESEAPLGITKNSVVARDMAARVNARILVPWVKISPTWDAGAALELWGNAEHARAPVPREPRPKGQHLRHY